MCFCLLAKRDLILFPLELKFCKTVWPVDMVCAEDPCWSSGGGAHCAFSQAHLVEKKSTYRVQRSEAWCKQFKPPMLELYCLQKLVYAEVQWREMVSAPSLISQEGVCAYCCLTKPSQKSEQSPLMCPSYFCLHPACVGASAYPGVQCTLGSIQAGQLTIRTPIFRELGWQRLTLVIWGEVLLQ